MQQNHNPNNRKPNNANNLSPKNLSTNNLSTNNLSTNNLSVNNKCPICNKTIQDNVGLCMTCGWDFQYFIIGMTSKEEQFYKNKMEIARRNWKALTGAIKRIKILEAKILELS